MRYVPNGGRHLPLTCGPASARHIRAPDASEGLFGRLKNEFFYHRDWRGVTLEEFMERLDAYLVYYNEGRPKESLGWMTPAQKRAAFYEGVVA